MFFHQEHIHIRERIAAASLDPLGAPAAPPRPAAPPASPAAPPVRPRAPPAPFAAAPAALTLAQLVAMYAPVRAVIANVSYYPDNEGSAPLPTAVRPSIDNAFESSQLTCSQSPPAAAAGRAVQPPPAVISFIFVPQRHTTDVHIACQHPARFCSRRSGICSARARCTFYEYWPFRGFLAN